MCGLGAGGDGSWKDQEVQGGGMVADSMQRDRWKWGNLGDGIENYHSGNSLEFIKSNQKEDS